MKKILLIEDGPFETRGALLEDNQVVELQIERPESISRVGLFYLGRVSSILPDLNAAFVDLGTGEDGFLQYEDIPTGAKNIRTAVHEGESLLVQVIKDRQGGKGVQLGCRIEIKSGNLVFRPLGKGLGLSKSITSKADRARLEMLLAPYCDTSAIIARTSARDAADAALVGELELLKSEWVEIQAKAAMRDKPGPVGQAETPLSRILQDKSSPQTGIIANNATAFNGVKHYLGRRIAGFDGLVELWDRQPPLFEAMGVETALETAMQTRLALVSGGNITIEPTEALTVIDVNSGGRTGGAGRKSGALATNLEAAAAICRQIRLRNISGIIVIDFIQMNGKGDTRELTDALQLLLDQDPVTSRLIGMTELGLMQITRKRSRAPLREILCGPCPACDARESKKTEPTILAELFRALQAEAQFTRTAEINIRSGAGLELGIKKHQSLIEQELARPIAVTVDLALAPDEFQIG